MAADSVIGAAGRAGLVLILNGSRSQKVLRWEWDKLPDYGRLSHLTADEIACKVDWCIHKHWLCIEHDRDGIPLVYHSTQGWERVKQLWVERITGWFDAWLAAGQPGQVWPRLSTINREIKLMLLDKIVKRNAVRYVPILRVWSTQEVRKMRSAIGQSLHALEPQPQGNMDTEAISDDHSQLLPPTNG